MNSDFFYKIQVQKYALLCFPCDCGTLGDAGNGQCKLVVDFFKLFFALQFANDLQPTTTTTAGEDGQKEVYNYKVADKQANNDTNQTLVGIIDLLDNCTEIKVHVDQIGIDAERKLFLLNNSLYLWNLNTASIEFVRTLSKNETGNSIIHVLRIEPEIQGVQIAYNELGEVRNAFWFVSEINFIYRFLNLKSMPPRWI